MNNAKLAQATLMALTRQNVTPRNAPNSTATMHGMVINRNIKTGDTVCCYYNDADELLRVGDVPSLASEYFVDDNNKLYDIANGKLRMRDGLSGTVYDDESIPAYGFKAGYNCGAYKSSEDTNEWVVILPNGTFTNPIFIDTTRMDLANIGYGNGTIAVVYAARPYNNPLITTTYNERGQLIAQLSQFSTGISASPMDVCPINAYTVSVAISAGLISGYVHQHYVVTNTDATGYDIYDGYETAWGHGETTTHFYCGSDQAYHYFGADITEYNEETGYYDKTGEQVIIKCEFESGSKTTIIDTPVQYGYTRCTMYSHAIRSRTVDGVTTRQMTDLLQGMLVWTSALPNITADVAMQENVGFIWVPQTGVYQKMLEDWLMYPTSEYPVRSPWGRLGYAVHDANIGKEGLAIVLFDKG